MGSCRSGRAFREGARRAARSREELAAAPGVTLRRGEPRLAGEGALKPVDCRVPEPGTTQIPSPAPGTVSSSLSGAPLRFPTPLHRELLGERFGARSGASSKLLWAGLGLKGFFLSFKISII